MRLEKLEPRVVLDASSTVVPTTLLDQSYYVATHDTLADQEAFVRAQLAINGATTHLQRGLSDVRLVEVKYGVGGIYNRFVQTIDGVDLFEGWVTVNQRPDGSVQQIYDQGIFAADASLTDAKFTESLHLRAQQIAMNKIGANTTFAPSQGKAVWYANEKGDLVKAWQVMVFPNEHVGDYLAVVNADNHALLHFENRSAHATGSGETYVPNPYQTQGSGTGLTDNNDADSAALQAQEITVTLQGLDDGTGLLIGEFVDLATLNSPTLPDVDANEPTRVYNYDRSDDRFEQVLVYHSVDSMNRYFHALGFDDDSGVPNGIRDFPTLANAHWYTADNSFYSTGDDAIHFGDGGVDDAEDADIVAHEYGHAVQFNQNSSWGGGEMGAMGEGFGDYLAASFYADEGDPAFQALHAPCVGEWDATSYSSTNPPCLRRVDGNKMYPTDLVGQVHADGEIWSRALWDVRAAIGAAAADQLILEHHFGLPGGATMPVAADWMLQVNQTLNGGANEAAIRQAFIDRGILEAPPTEGTVALDQPAYNESDTITVTVVDANAVLPLQVTFTSDSGDTEVITLNSAGGDTYTGTIDTMPGAPASDGVLQVALGDQIQVEYVDTDDGNGGTVTVTDSALISDIIKYSADDVPIVLEAGPHLSVINVPDAGRVGDIDIQFDIDHTFDADLDVFLIAPDGTRVELFTDVGGSGDDFENTILDDEAPDPIASGTAPFAGSYSPEGSLSDFDGLLMAGDWTLEISDDFPFDADNGVLNSWTICIVRAPDMTEGSVAFDDDQYNPEDVVTVTVTDANAVAPVMVTLTSDSGDTETLELADIGNDEYSATINTATGDVAADGILQVALGDLINVEYVDPDDGSGGTLTAVDSAEIVNTVKIDASDVPIVIEAGPHLSVINVPNAGFVGDVNVELDITHTFAADLDVFLISPLGTRVELFTDVGGGGDNFTGTVLDQEATTSIADGSAPFTGVFQPEGDMSVFYGQEVTGNWTLEINDDFPFDVDSGVLNAWTICFELEPPVVLTEISVQTSTAIVNETGGLAQFVVSVPDFLFDQTVTVDYATVGTTAADGVDYQAASGTLTFFQQTRSHTIQVPIFGDQISEIAEEFALVLSNPVRGEIAVGTALVSITDDDIYTPGTIVDFGTQTSPVFGGAIGIDSLEYDVARQFGWNPGSSNLRTVERASGDDLQRDIALLESGSFVVDTANAGPHTILVTVGDADVAHDDMQIAYNGQTLAVVSTAAGEFQELMFRVVHAGGPLQIDFSDLGGSDADVAVAGLQVFETDEYHLDFGPFFDVVVESGYELADNSVYGPDRAFGWLSADIKYLDSGVPNDLLRDAAAIYENEFIVNLANGTYDITVHTGNEDFGQYGVFLAFEDLEVDNLFTAPGEFYTNTYQVTVTDQTLNMRVKENGGLSPFGMIAGMDIVPSVAKRSTTMGTPPADVPVRDLAFVSSKTEATDNTPTPTLPSERSTSRLSGLGERAQFVNGFVALPEPPPAFRSQPIVDRVAFQGLVAEAELGELDAAMAAVFDNAAFKELE